MEFSIKMLAVIVIVLIVAVVCIALITGWGTQSNAAIDGLMDFFNSMLSGRQAGSLPSMPVK